MRIWIAILTLLAGCASQAAEPTIRELEHRASDQYWHHAHEQAASLPPILHVSMRHFDSTNSEATGVVIFDDDQQTIVLTNWHPYRDPVKFVHVGSEQIPWVRAETIATDRPADIALLRIRQALGIQPIEFGSDPVAGVQYSMAGFPESSRTAQIRTGAATSSRWESAEAVGRGYFSRSFLMRSGQGFSGSPVIDRDGRLVALCWGYINGETYATPASVIMATFRFVGFTQYCRNGSCFRTQRSQPRIVYSKPKPTYAQPTYKPAPKPTQPPQVDTEKLIARVIEIIATDPRFRGPAGPEGKPGRDGTAGIGTRGPAGENGKDAPPYELTEQDVDKILARLNPILNDIEYRLREVEDRKIEFPNRRVILVNGATRQIIDDEDYPADEPIIIDVQAVINARTE